MRVLVCGGRRFDDWTLLSDTLNAIHAETPVSLVIHGAAHGADALAEYWADRHGIPIGRYPAAWDIYDRSAGPIRNAQMLRDGRPDLVVAFPGGKGTTNVEVREVGTR